MSAHLPVFRGAKPSEAITERDLHICALVTEGLTNQEIAAAIGTTENMAKNYLRFIYNKTGMGNRVELALWYLEHHDN